MAQQGINKAIVVGLSGQDPKMSKTNSGDDCAILSLATGRTWQEQDGTSRKITNWHNVVAYKGAAKYIQLAVKKGSKVYVEGEMQTRKWTDSNNVSRETMQIVVNTVQVLANGRDNNQQNSGAAQYAGQNAVPQQATPQTQTNRVPQQVAEPVDDFDDDIPF